MRCLEHRLERGGQREHALARSGVAADRDDPDVVVGQQIEGETLLGRPSADAEQLAFGRDQPDALVVVHACQRRLRAGDEGQTGVARQHACFVEVEDPSIEQLVDQAAVDIEGDEPVPRRVRGQLVAVLVGVEADDARLQPERKVLRHERDVVALGRQVAGDGEDPVVVRRDGHRLRQARRVLMVDLDAQRAAQIVDGYAAGERTVLRAQALELT